MKKNKIELPIPDKQIEHLNKSKVQFTTVSNHYMGCEDLETIEIECTSENILKLQNADIHFTKSIKK